MVNSMKRLLEMGGQMTVWNEVVIAKPRRIESVVLAVIYLETNDMSIDEKQWARRQAIKKAKLLGGRPVLAFDVNEVENGEPVLSCIADDEENYTDTTPFKQVGQFTRADRNSFSLRQHIRGLAA